MGGQTKTICLSYMQTTLVSLVVETARMPENTCKYVCYKEEPAILNICVIPCGMFVLAYIGMVC